MRDSGRIQPGRHGFSRGLDGNTHFQGGSTVTVNQVDPVDSNLAVGGNTGPPMTLSWSEVRD